VEVSYSNVMVLICALWPEYVGLAWNVQYPSLTNLVSLYGPSVIEKYLENGLSPTLLIQFSSVVMLLEWSHSWVGMGTSCAMPLISNQTGFTGLVETTCRVSLFSAVTLFQSVGMPPMPAPQLSQGALGWDEASTMSQEYTTSWAVTG